MVRNNSGNEKTKKNKNKNTVTFIRWDLKKKKATF